MATRTERRKKTRNRPPRLVYVELESGNGGMMRDLTENGFAVRAIIPLRVGEKTQFSFSLDSAAPISGEGRIAWVAEDGRVAGLEFSGLSALAHRQIAEWLANPGRGAKETPATKRSETGAPSLEQLRTEARTVLSSTPVPVSEAPPNPPPAELTPPPLTDQAVRHIPISAPVSEAPVNPPPAELTLAPPPEQEVRNIPFSLPVSAALANPQPAGPPLPPLADILILPQLSETAGKAQAAVATSGKETETAPGRHAVGPADQRDRETGLVPPLEEALPATSGTKRKSLRGFTLSRAIAAMVILTLIAGGVVFHRPFGYGLVWLGQRIAGSEPQDTTQEPAISEAAPIKSSPENHASPATSAPMPGENATSPVEQTAAPTQEERKNEAPAPIYQQSSRNQVPPVTVATPHAPSKLPTPPALEPMSHVSKTTGSATPGEVAANSGAVEYQQALQILRDKGKGADAPEAVRLLWVAVEKGNDNAVVELADMYWLGDGVAKNCDQARLLLSAAARKGNAEAKARLEKLAREGCQ